MRAKLHCLTALLVGTLATASLAQQAVRWQPNLQAGRQLAGQSNRLVLLHFWAPSCGACMRMEQDVFSRPDVAAAIEGNYVAVRLNADHFPTIAKQYGVTALPTDLVLTPQGELVHKVVGFRPAADYTAAMNLIANHARANAQRYALNQATPPGNPQIPMSGGGAASGLASRPPMASEVDGQERGPSASTPVTAPYSPPLADAVRPNSEGVSAGQLGPANPGPGKSPAGPPLDTMGAPPSGATAHAGPPSLPPGMPPLGLDGYSPVALREKGKWVWGDRRWGAFHQGRTYLFAEAQEQEQFLKNPEAYAPVLAGIDLVLLVEGGQMVPGHRRFGAWFEDRVYLFSSEATFQKFYRDAPRYVTASNQMARPRTGNYR